MSTKKSARCSGLSLPAQTTAEGEPGREKRLIQHWNTMPLLHRPAFKTNHLGWKLSTSCCKSQWFKYYLLVQLGSVFGPTPDPFQSSIQKFRKGFGSLPATIVQSALITVNFQKITSEAKFIMHFIKKGMVLVSFFLPCGF